jgi:antitoxin ChpS
MLTVPRTILDLLHLQVGATVDLAVEAGRLVVQPQAKPRYTLDQLLARCDSDAAFEEKDRDWLNLTPVGREL